MGEAAEKYWGCSNLINIQRGRNWIYTADLKSRKVIVRFIDSDSDERLASEVFFVNYLASKGVRVS